jgi:hypothetical protein
MDRWNEATSPVIVTLSVLPLDILVSRFDDGGVKRLSRCDEVRQELVAHRDAHAQIRQAGALPDG